MEASAPRDSVAFRTPVANAWHASGAIHAAIANTENGERRERDRKTARDALERAIAEWQRLASLPGFTTLHQKRMNATAADLRALNAITGRPQ
jgi:hypothetical protein